MIILGVDLIDVGQAWKQQGREGERIRMHVKVNASVNLKGYVW